MKRRRSGLAAAAVVLATLAGGNAEEEKGLLRPGSTAPTFSLPSLEGERVALRVWCGKTLAKPYLNTTKHVVVLSFWATYCKPCQKEIPQLMKFRGKHADDSVKVFGISLDEEGKAVVAPFVKEKKYSLPMLIDRYKRTSSRYGVTSLPALFVIDGEGIVRYSSTGYSDSVSLVDKLEEVLAGIRGRARIPVPAAVETDSGSVGETVPVASGSASRAVGPRDKWRAVARVECGESLDDIADELEVSPDTVSGWYEELKKAALSQWKTEKDRKRKN